MKQKTKNIIAIVLQLINDVLRMIAGKWKERKQQEDSADKTT